MWILSFTFYCLLSTAACTLLGWLVLWVAVHLLAKQRGHTVSVAGVSFLHISKFSFNFGKGLVSHFGLDDLCIFRDAKWSKTLESWFREGNFPVYLGGASLSMNLENLKGSQAHSQASPKMPKNKKGTGLTFSKKVLKRVYTLVLWVLPKIPITVCNVRVHIEDVGITVTIPRIALLFRKCKQGLGLHGSLKITEIMGLIDHAGTESIPLGRITDSSLALGLSNTGEGLPHMDNVDINFDELSISLSDAVVDAAVELLAKAKSISLPKRDLGKAKRVPTHPSPDLINLLPGEMGFNISHVSIDFGNQNSTVPMLAALSFGNLCVKSETKKKFDSVHAEATVSSIQIKGGEFHDKKCALTGWIPKITTVIGMNISKEGGLPVCISGAMDVQGLTVVIDGDKVPLFLSEGENCIKKWDSKLAIIHQSNRQMQDPMVDEVEVIEGSNAKEKTIERKPKKELSMSDPEEGQTLGLATGEGCTVPLANPGEPLVVDTAIGEQHNRERRWSSTHADLEPASLKHKYSHDSLEEIPQKPASTEWKIQLKISSCVTMELTSKHSEPKFLISVESAWSEATLIRDSNSISGLMANLELAALKIQLAPAHSEGGPDCVTNILSVTSVCGRASASDSNATVLCPIGVELGVHVSLKSIAVYLNSSVVNSSISLASYYAKLVCDLGGLFKSKQSAKSKENMLLKKNIRLGKWKVGIEDVTAAYETVLVPVEAYLAGEHAIPYMAEFSLKCLEVEPWEHWKGGQSVVENIKVELYQLSAAKEQRFTLISLNKLHSKVEDRGGTVGIQILGNAGDVNVNIDAAFVLMNVALEMTDFSRKLADLTKNSRRQVDNTEKESLLQESNMSQKMSFSLCAHDLKIGVAIGEMDHVSIVILEAHTDTRTMPPRVYVKQVEIFMNESQLIVSKHLSLIVKLPMPLGATEELQQRPVLVKRSTFGRNRDKEPMPEAQAVAELDNLGCEQQEPASSIEATTGARASSLCVTRGSSMNSFLQRESGNLSIASTMGSVEFMDEQFVDDKEPIKPPESNSVLRRRKALASLGLISSTEEAETEQTMDILQIEMEMDTLCVILPHDQHVGRLTMFTELWVDAAKKVIADYINQLKSLVSRRDPSSSTEDKQSPPALVEVCIKSNNLSFRVAAHPFEAWLSLNGRLLRSIIMQGQAWQSAIDSALDDDEEDPGHAGRSGEAAKEWIMHELFTEYYQKSNALKAECASDLHHRGALMSVASGTVDALILVGEKSNPKIFEACVQRIREIDKPSSDGIMFSKAQPIYLDGKLSDITAHFGGLHAAHISEIGISGLIARGRQLTHGPKLETVVFKVGDWHKVPMDLPIKGARPPMKAYTQLKTTITGMNAQASIGLEPVWSQMAGAFNRLTPPSEVHSDGRLKDPAPGLQPWDKMRNVWRGSLGICIRQMKAAFGATVNPVVTAQSDRVELDVDELNIDVMAGQIDLHAIGMQITMFMMGLRGAPEHDLHVLPLGRLPNALIKFKFSWQMPNGRSQLDHYAYPRVTKPDEHILLDPVVLTKQFVGEGYTFSISAKLDGDMSLADKAAEVPEVILGEAQIRFLVKFVKLMENAPVHIRGCWKRGTYFARKKKKNTVGLELPNLLHRLEVSASSRTVEIKHHTLEADDPSSDMIVYCEMVRFAGTWGFLRNIDIANRLRAGKYHPEPRWKEVDGIWRRSPGPKVPPDMEILEVEAFQIQGFLPDKHATNPLLNRARLEAEHNSFLVHLLQQKSSRRNPSEFQTTQPTGSEGHILSASCFWLRQLGGPGSGKDFDVQVTLPSGQKKRPLKIMMEDVKALVPVEVRDAILGVFMHMSSAFTGPSQGSSGDVGQTQPQTESTIAEPIEEQKSGNESGQSNRESLFVKALLEQGSDFSAADDALLEKAAIHQMIDLPPVGSKRVLELEFVHVQLGLVSDISEGAVLLTLDNGQLHEHLDDQNHIRTLGLNVNHVKCYAMDTSIDPLNPVRWLEVTDGCLEIPSDSTGILTPIVEPFRVQMSDTFLSVKAQALNPGRAAEDLKLKSPHIEAVTESGQFEILVDVINSVATPPLPHISLLRDHILGTSVSALEDTNEDIQEAKRKLQAVYVDFNAKRQEVFDVWCASGEGFEHSLGNLLFGSGACIRDKFTRDSEGIDQPPRFAEFIKSFPQQEGVSVLSFEGEKPIQLFYGFLNERIETARMSCLKHALHLSEARKENEENNKHKKLFKSMSMSFNIDNVSWTLRREGADFMRAQIQGVTYSSFQNKDLSGESKVSVQGMCLLDAEGVISATPGLSQGVVLSALYPQGPGEEILRGLAVRGGQTSSHVYYEHIEVWVHPLGLHFTERLAREVAAYFFGADESSLHKEQEDFVRGVEHSIRGLERVSSLGSTSGSDGDSSPDAGVPPGHQQVHGGEVATLQKSLGPSAKSPCQSDPLESLMEIKSPIVKERKQKGLSKRRKVHFVHVRFNKVTTQITYEGRPFPIYNLDIIIRMNEYNNVIGHFNDILRKYRNNCITSVLKSAGGLLGRRYDPEEDFGEKTRKKGMKERLMSRIRKGKSSIVGVVEGVVEGVVDMATSTDELQKEEKAKKMILGEP